LKTQSNPAGNRAATVPAGQGRNDTLWQLRGRRDIAATLPRFGSGNGTSTANAELSADHHRFVKIIVSANYPPL
jgi:hypothetical protein